MRLLSRFYHRLTTLSFRRFDLLHILPALIKQARLRKWKVAINRKGTEVRFLRVHHFYFMDLAKVSQGSLQRLGEMLGVEKKTRTALAKSYCVPYYWFDSMERLFERRVPDLSDPSWLSLREGEPMIGESEHAEIARAVAEVGWYEFFSLYLRKDCVLVLASLLIMDDLYADEFGVDLLGCNYTSAGAVITSHLDATVIASGTHGFCQIKNQMVGEHLCSLRVGGIVEGRAKRSGALPEADDGGSVGRVYGFDLNQVISNFPPSADAPYIVNTRSSTHRRST